MTIYMSSFVHIYRGLIIYTQEKEQNQILSEYAIVLYFYTEYVENASENKKSIIYTGKSRKNQTFGSPSFFIFWCLKNVFFVVHVS